MSEKESSLVVAARRCYRIIDDIHAVATILSTPAKQVSARQVRSWVGNSKNPTKDYELSRVYDRRTRANAVNMYTEHEMSMAAVAREIGCVAGTVKNWLLEADIVFRNARSILTLRSGTFRKFVFEIPKGKKRGHLSVAA